MRQLGLLGRRFEQSKHSILAPSTYAPVDDVVDPEHGPDEIHPAPAAEPYGSILVVGRARHVWWAGSMWSMNLGKRSSRGDPRMTLCRMVDHEGRLWPIKAAHRHLKREGARLVYIPERFVPHKVRDTLDDRLRDAAASDPAVQRWKAQCMPLRMADDDAPVMGSTEWR